MKKEGDSKSMFEKYRPIGRMVEDGYRLRFADRERTGETMQLPAGLEASLFEGITEHRLIRKFRKAKPEFYLAVETLLKDEDFLSSKRVFVRENNFGLVPVLLALGHQHCLFLVSCWMIDKEEIIERNALMNLVDDRILFVVEGLKASMKRNYNASILVHEQHQNPDILVYEAAKALSPDTCSFLYLITHKNKGGVSITERISRELGVSVSFVKRGIGGARVAKFMKEGSISTPAIPGFEFDYCPRRGVKVKFRTVSSLFSSEGVDIGTDFLIKEVLSEIDPQREISIYDLACGYGVIGLSIAACLSRATVVMSDADARAVDIARLNVQVNNLDDRVSVELADGAKGISGNFDLVISNPPLHTERRKIIEILTAANKLVIKGGKMLLVVEDSRVEEIREILKPRTGFVRVKAKTPSHSILEIL